EGLACVELAREVPPVADPDGVGPGPELLPELEAVEVVVHGLPADRVVGVAEAPELVRVPLALLVLERVRVHGVEEEAAGLGEGAQLARIVRLVPGNVEGDSGGGPRELEDDRAVLDLLEDVAGLARAGEPREPRAPRAHSPRRHRHAEGRGFRDERLDVEAAPGE